MAHSTLPEHFVEPPASAFNAVTRRHIALLVILGLWLVIFFSSLFAPALLDDADATHANAARHMALTGDLVTLHVNGIRYLEKAPLPYWLVALSFRIFGFNTFAAHLPQAIAVLLLALLGFHWAGRAFNGRTAFYTGISILTAAGVFLFTRIFIPEVLLSLFLCISLYSLLRTLEEDHSSKPATTLAPAVHAYIMWTVIALAVLTKGLVALVFFLGTAIAYLVLTGEYKSWRRLRPITGLLLFFAVAAPWHILAGLRNTGGMDGHGFFWFYFVNEHFLRFLGKRIPMDYNKLPGYLYWSLHLVWLFPWGLFLGVLVRQAYSAFQRYTSTNPLPSDRTFYWQPFAVVVVGILLRDTVHIPYLFTVFLAIVGFMVYELRRRQSEAAVPTPLVRTTTFSHRTTLLLGLFSTLVLVFFSLSTNQEYYTFPAYLPLLILIAAALVSAEETYTEDKSSQRWIDFAHAAFTLFGFAISLTLVIGLWRSRNLPFVPDIGELVAHRNVGDYTLSMSHLFDLTGPSFAALRLPAVLAALTFAIGPGIAWMLRIRRRHIASTIAVALTSTIFLIAAHIAFVRFGTMLSSQDFAQKIQQLESDHAVSSDAAVLIYGDQAYGSSIPFYLGRNVYLVDGRSTSMLFGSTFPDAPPLFLTSQELLKDWGSGRRKLLFVPLEKRDAVDQLLGSHKLLLKETSGKALFTDRPLDSTNVSTATQDPR
jgi:4-amino-4-deoxy-L-arabinose transferase-like glycosyltransferase